MFETVLPEVKVSLELLTVQPGLAWSAAPFLQNLCPRTTGLSIKSRNYTML